jgi:SAM-dependent methyltransferase
MARGGLDGYFTIGREGLHCVEAALLAVPDTFRPPRIERILDMPCGHGRVLRFLRAAFPDAEITACDVDRDGVDFCARTFGVRGVYSRDDPQEIDLDGGFDLVWCGSLLTHLPAERFRAFLRFFESMLAYNGLLVFTTHGRRAADLLRRGETGSGLDEAGASSCLEDFERSGFGFAAYGKNESFGFSLSSPSWVCAQVEAIPSWRLLSFTEMGWASHQDAVSLIRRPIEDVRLGMGVREHEPRRTPR